MTDYLLIIVVSVAVSIIVTLYLGDGKKSTVVKTPVAEEYTAAEIPSSIEKPKSEFTLDDVGICEYLFNCYSILLYILAVIVYFFPPHNTLAWDYPWLMPIVMIIAGPIGSWAMVSDMKANKKRKHQEQQGQIWRNLFKLEEAE